MTGGKSDLTVSFLRDLRDDRVFTYYGKNGD